MREILFYRTESGACPVEVFLDSLTGQQAQKVTWVLRLVEEIDRVPAQYFKKLANTDGIWEIRAESGGDAFRLLGFLHGLHFVVLNHAFRKKSQKTPQADIRLAETRKTDYLRRQK